MNNEKPEDKKLIDSRYRFTVHLGGLIELLSDALYTRESVFIRELIQNAVDAVHARQLLEPSFRGSVNIQFYQGDDNLWRLSIEDNGIGLSEDEVHEFLATIGASMKRGDLEKRRNESFIGQFGVGFLSCFLVSDEVTLVTRRAMSAESPTLKWEGRKDGSYTLAEVPQARGGGSTVYLTLKEDTREVYSGDRLFSIARKYGSFLPVPIDFMSAETGRVRLNPSPFPWLKNFTKRGSQQREWVNFAEEVLGAKFLAAFKFDCEELGVTGMVCIPAEPIGILDKPHHTVFLKGMFVSRVIEGVAPSHIPFLQCILNATQLRPNAAREGLQDSHESLEPVRRSVQAAFSSFVSDCSEDDPMLLRKILEVHTRNLIELAGQDINVLKCIRSLLRLETSLGVKSLEEMQHDQAQKYFIVSYEEFKRVEALAQSNNVTLINAGYSGLDRLMRSVAEQLPECKFRETDSTNFLSLLDRATKVVTKAHGVLRLAKKSLRKLGVGVALLSDPRSRFAATVEVPLDNSLRRRAAGSRAPFLEEFDRYSGSDAHITLHLNTAHPLIQTLSASDVPEGRACSVLAILYHNALVTAREIPSEQEGELYEQSLRALLAGSEGSGF